jgi:hypothetical protein
VAANELPRTFEYPIERYFIFYSIRLTVRGRLPKGVEVSNIFYDFMVCLAVCVSASAGEMMPVKPESVLVYQPKFLTFEGGEKQFTAFTGTALSVAFADNPAYGR